MRSVAVPALSLLLAALGWAGANGPPTPAEQYQALVKEYDGATQKVAEEYRAAKTADERQKALEGRPDAAAFAKKLLAVAKGAPKDPAAVDALVWVGTHACPTPEGRRALELLARDHVISDKIGPVCARLANLYSPQIEPFLRDVIAKNVDHVTKGQACLALGQHLKRQAELVRSLREDPRMVQRVGAMAEFGPERVKELLAKDPDAIMTEAERLLERVVKEFGDVKPNGQPIGQRAEGELFELRHLSVGKPAPEIEGEDIDGVKLKLSDYRGKIVLLDFWGHW
jgi:hypothetical protein